MAFDVTLYDCPAASESDCVLIGKASSDAPVNAPPRQARNFTAALYYGAADLKLKGRLVWKYDLTSITGSRQ